VELDLQPRTQVTPVQIFWLGVGRAGLGLLDTANHGSGVGDVADRAGALGAVVHNLAVGVGSAGVGAAWVGAVVVDASV